MSPTMHRRTTRPGLALALLLGLAFMVAPAPAHAGDVWTTPFHGVRLLTRTTNAPLRVHAAVVDLCYAGVSVRATRPTERGRTAGSFGNLTGAELVINGDFFSGGFNPSGMAIGKGTWWGEPDNSWEGFVAFGKDRADLSPPDFVLREPTAWTTELVSGRPQLVGDGQRLAIPQGSRSVCDTRAPRSAVGLSRDGSKLILAVVDRTPRTTGTRSRGMTCTEMGDLMRSLGAHDALNLDGGGSSQLWMKGRGYLNDASGNNYGAGVRSTANHLAIFAKRSGTPGSCPLAINPIEPAEAERDFPPMPGTLGSSDIDGDGMADVCLRSPTGFSCTLGASAASSFAATVLGPALTDSSGWADLSNALSMAMGDLDGDGRDDLCARANAGVRCWRSLGTGFASPAIVGPPFSDASGFGARQYYTTFRLADVNGDGKADACIRTATRFRCDLSTGAGFAGQVVATGLSSAAGFSAQSAWGTLQMGDVNGDGRADVCARNPTRGMQCWLSDGAAFSTLIEGPAWTDAAGWAASKYWRTIRLTDVNGDGRADLCARTARDFRCHLSTGRAFGRAMVGPPLANDQGWGDISNFETIRLADIDGDGDRDLCARGDLGITCWPFTHDDFGAAMRTTRFSDASGWAPERFHSTIHFADLDGDGRADLCARASAGLRCALTTTTAALFGDNLVGPAWSDASGHNTLATYGTLIFGDPPMRLAAKSAALTTDLESGPGSDPGMAEELACGGAHLESWSWLMLGLLALRGRSRWRTA